MLREDAKSPSCNPEVEPSRSPGQIGCWAQGSWVKVSPDRGLDIPQFELVTADISASLEAVQREMEQKYDRAAGRFINRQTAVQPDGAVVTEEAKMKKAE